MIEGKNGAAIQMTDYADLIPIMITCLYVAGWQMAEWHLQQHVASELNSLLTDAWQPHQRRPICMARAAHQAKQACRSWSQGLQHRNIGTCAGACKQRQHAGSRSNDTGQMHAANRSGPGDCEPCQLSEELGAAVASCTAVLLAAAQQSVIGCDSLRTGMQLLRDQHQQLLADASTAHRQVCTLWLHGQWQDL